MISYAFVTIRFVTIVWLKFDNLSLEFRNVFRYERKIGWSTGE